MSAGYQIVTTPFTVEPGDPRVVDQFPDFPDVDPAVRFSAQVTAQAPPGKRWLLAVGELRNHQRAHHNRVGIGAPAITLNGNGTQYTTLLAMDVDGTGQPVTTTRVVRVIAVDA